jgi:hypothetical protein
VFLYIIENLESKTYRVDTDGDWHNCKENPSEVYESAQPQPIQGTVEVLRLAFRIFGASENFGILMCNPTKSSHLRREYLWIDDISSAVA